MFNDKPRQRAFWSNTPPFGAAISKSCALYYSQNILDRRLGGAVPACFLLLETTSRLEKRFHGSKNCFTVWIETSCVQIVVFASFLRFLGGFVPKPPWPGFVVKHRFIGNFWIKFPNGSNGKRHKSNTPPFAEIQAHLSKSVIRTVSKVARR